jgi:hypothetical protein
MYVGVTNDLENRLAPDRLTPSQLPLSRSSPDFTLGYALLKVERGGVVML